MSPSELEELFMENPDKPHRLTLSSGDPMVIVPSEQVSYIHGISLGLLKYVAPGRFMASRRLVSIPNIVVAEVVDRPSPPPRRRRK